MARHAGPAHGLEKRQLAVRVLGAGGLGQGRGVGVEGLVQRQEGLGQGRLEVLAFRRGQILIQDEAVMDLLGLLGHRAVLNP
ncbi:MAG: hypothetical protein V5A50_07715 [Thiohalorhabdus sp.]